MFKRIILLCSMIVISQMASAEYVEAILPDEMPTLQIFVDNQLSTTVKTELKFLHFYCQFTDSSGCSNTCTDTIYSTEKSTLCKPFYMAPAFPPVLKAPEGYNMNNPDALVFKDRNYNGHIDLYDATTNNVIGEVFFKLTFKHQWPYGDYLEWQPLTINPSDKHVKIEKDNDTTGSCYTPSRAKDCSRTVTFKLTRT